MRSLGLNSAVIGGILLAVFAALEWHKNPASQIAAPLASAMVYSEQAMAHPSESDSSKTKPVIDGAEPEIAKSSHVSAAAAAPAKTKRSSKEKPRRDSLEDSPSATESVAPAPVDEVSLQTATSALKKQHQSQRDRSDSLESVSSQSSTQSQPVAENRNVSFAEKPVELDKKQSPPDLKKQAPSILKQNKSTPPAASQGDSNAPTAAPSRAAPLPPSSSQSAASTSSNSVSPGADLKLPQSQSATGGSHVDEKVARNGTIPPAIEHSKAVASGKSAPIAIQQPPVKVGAPSSALPLSSAKLPGNIAHLQPAVSAADSSRGDTLEWNVALDSSDGIDSFAGPGPSNLHSIDKMYRNMSMLPPFLQSTQSTIRPSFSDTSASQSSLDEAALKAKAREKIKQFVVGDVNIAAPYASGAPPFVSRNPPASVTRAFSAPAATISNPSLASSQPWQIPSFVPDSSFSSQQQTFPTTNSALPANAISSIWGGSSSANLATPVPFTAPLASTAWGSFPSVSPQQEMAVSEMSGQQQPSATDDNLFFFEDFGPTSS